MQNHQSPSSHPWSSQLLLNPEGEREAGAVEPGCWVAGAGPVLSVPDTSSPAGSLASPPQRASARPGCDKDSGRRETSPPPPLPVPAGTPPTPGHPQPRHLLLPVCRWGPDSESTGSSPRAAQKGQSRARSRTRGSPTRAYEPEPEVLFFLSLKINLFFNFWLHWVFIAARGISPVVASEGRSCGSQASYGGGFPCWQSRGSVAWPEGSVALLMRDLPRPGIKLRPLPWQADS